MITPAQRFLVSIKGLKANQANLVDLFVYHLTIEMDYPAATVKLISECYRDCDLKVPARLAVHLSEGLRKPVRYIRKNGGYRLESGRREAIERLLGNERTIVQTSVTLRKLESRIPVGAEREFLKETIDCFMAGANRAAVVMCWNLALHHLQEYVLAHHVIAFNGVLAKSTDSRVKIRSVSKHDDFTEMPESIFLLFCRQAKIITSTIFKKLGSRLDDRNAAAHPSGVKITPKLAESYIDDLIENIVLKYIT
jgi:hypothetical protein